MGSLAALITVLLAGSWITFGLPLASQGFSTRWLAGILLAPLVIVIQFFALRCAGVSFPSTAWSIFFLNLPASLLILRARKTVLAFDRRSFLAHLAGLALPLGLLAYRFSDVQARVMHYGHPWMQSDVVYSFANGSLLPEEPELAGVVLNYPWAGHVFQAVISFLQGSPPVFNYSWTMLLWFGAAAILASRIIGALGGSLFARVTGIWWFCFGINFAGYFLHQVCGLEMSLSSQKRHEFWGDLRYSPWVSYFGFFNHLELSIGTMTAALLVVVRAGARNLSPATLILLGALLLATGILYPFLMPCGCLVGGCWIVAKSVAGAGTESRAALRNALGALAGILIAAAASLAFLKLLARSQTGGVPLQLSSPGNCARKTLESLIVCLPLLAGVVPGFRRLGRERRVAALTLVLGALGCLVAHVLFEFHGGLLNYKMILAGALFLFPFTPIALAGLRERHGMRASIGIVLFLLVAASFTLHKYLTKYPKDIGWIPRLQSEGFDIRFPSDTPESALFDHLRSKTPLDTVVVMERSRFHAPSLMRRSFYVTPLGKDDRPGYNFQSTFNLITLRNYGAAIVNSRQADLTALYGGDDAGRAAALARMRSLGRPVGIVLEISRHAALAAALRALNHAEPAFSGGGFEVWQLDALP